MSSEKETVEFALSMAEQLNTMAQEIRDKVSESSAELSGSELDEAVAAAAGWREKLTEHNTPHGFHTFHPSKCAHDIAFAWACKPLREIKLIIDAGDLIIDRSDKMEWETVSPLEASRIFVEAHRKDGE